MECNWSNFTPESCSERIKEILEESDTSYQEIDEVPSRSRLTYKNGFYVDCIAMFVDIRESSKLPEYHKRPALARLYRAFTSEITAAMAGNENIAEVNIIGDCVAGVFNGHTKLQVWSVFDTSTVISSTVELLNYHFRKKGMKEIKVGIGICDGRALMIQGGKKGSGVNEALWMGEVVNLASHLSHKANRSSPYGSETMVTGDIFVNLRDGDKKLLNLVETGIYAGSYVNRNMDEWMKENCK